MFANLSLLSVASFLPEEEQQGPLVLEEAGDDAESDDSRENGEEQEGECDHDEEQGVRCALVVESGGP